MKQTRALTPLVPGSQSRELAAAKISWLVESDMKPVEGKQGTGSPHPQHSCRKVKKQKTGSTPRCKYCEDWPLRKEQALFLPREAMEKMALQWQGD